MPAVASMNISLALESENRTLNPAIVEQGVTACLNDTNKGWYLLACENDRPVGQLMITLEWSDWRNGWFWWIQSVYVLPTYRGKGIFRKLFENVSLIAKKEMNVVGIRLYVEEHNHSARKVYEKLGMHPAGYEVLEAMFDEKP